MPSPWICRSCYRPSPTPARPQKTGQWSASTRSHGCSRKTRSSARCSKSTRQVSRKRASCSTWNGSAMMRDATRACGWRRGNGASLYRRPNPGSARAALITRRRPRMGSGEEAGTSNNNSSSSSSNHKCHSNTQLAMARLNVRWTSQVPCGCSNHVDRHCLHGALDLRHLSAWVQVGASHRRNGHNMRGHRQGRRWI